MSTTSSTSTFWDRVGVSGIDRLRCMDIIRDRYSGYQVQEFAEQGYCSFTLIVSTPCNISSPNYEDGGVSRVLDFKAGQSLIVQLRPVQHALDMTTARAAKETYSSLAPNIRQLNLTISAQLCVYEMERIPGTPLSRVSPCSLTSDSTLWKKQERLIESFARLIAQSWHSSFKGLNTARNARADSPMEDMPDMLSMCKGKVGSSIIQRLEKLSRELPDAPLKARAKSTLTLIKTLFDFPVVLNHGDLIPSNILVDEDTWDITGLVDWAEAEYLPFGTCLYGLEHFLGYLAPPAADTVLACGNSAAFAYYKNADQLRELFWTLLFSLVPDLTAQKKDVRAMRDLGVLLWYGYAWDDGAIDRVVNEKDDMVEVACLRAFLAVT